MAISTATRTPAHLWIVGVLALFWNGFGAFDYVMSHMRGEPYYREMGMTDAQIAWMNAAPAWATAVWAIGVWGGVLGAILLLLRNRLAVPVFLASFLAFVASVLHTYLSPNGPEIMGSGPSAIMNLVIFAGGLFFIGYSRAMAKRGVLS